MLVLALDGPRIGTLTLSIDDWNTFTQSTEKPYSEPLILSGVQFTIDASISAQSLAVSLGAKPLANRLEWHCKAEFVPY
ncbi:hypothetical protein AAVH_25196 [Aphelenchoides avenae]|nr:hypothetical protein AAVH_25196 [Aphelenchus avenae]